MKKKVAGFPNLVCLGGTNAYTEEDIAKLFSSYLETLFCSGDTSFFNEASVQQEI